jgi:hypothetical protein
VNCASVDFPPLYTASLRQSRLVRSLQVNSPSLEASARS